MASRVNIIDEFIMCFHPQDAGSNVEEKTLRKSTASIEDDAGTSAEEHRRKRLLPYKDICIFCSKPAAPDPRHPGKYKYI